MFVGGMCRFAFKRYAQDLQSKDQKSYPIKRCNFLRKDSKLTEVSEIIEVPTKEPIKIPTQEPTSKPTKIPSKTWAREDRNMKRFLTTLRDGPCWEYVTGRATYDLDSGKEI